MESNRGLHVGDIVTEMRSHPYIKGGKGIDFWDFKKETLQFEILDVFRAEYSCRDIGDENNEPFYWQFWNKQPNHGFLPNGSSVVRYMAMKAYRAARTSRSKTRAFKGKYEGCGKSICSCRAYLYVDSDNAAITNSSPYLCKDCYEVRYNVRIPSDVEKYRKNLIAWLSRMHETPGLSPGKAEAMDMLVRIVQDKELL